MAASVKVMELGFIQKAEPWRLRSAQFPSKVGGRPALLGEVGVPLPEALQCGVCSQPLAFLLQVYAPCTGSFHRTLFIFCCRDPKCHQVSENRCFKVFRNQLPRKNDTYSYGPPLDKPPPASEDCISFQLKCGLRLCRVCGCLGPKKCSKCHKVNYCSRQHQLMDWKLQHKLCCEQFEVQTVQVPDHGFLFPEYELVTEPEETDYLHEDSMGMETQTSDEISSCIESSMDDLNLNEEDLDVVAKQETKEDKVFIRFKKLISREPEQLDKSSSELAGLSHTEETQTRAKLFAGRNEQPETSVHENRGKETHK
ncbi:programmed cell death protein 2 isoform X2 [Hyperolius riggenbachi]|uniref:programmed cell death protein 2 isoform X2 n=1 Tax=Hyperolius riggenbachi TaxID=752182 RepID=UPI0035A31656